MQYNRKVTITDPNLIQVIFGSIDKNIKRIEEDFNVAVSVSDNDNGGVDILIVGDSEDNVENASEGIESLKRLSSITGELPDETVEYVINMVKEGESEQLRSFDEGCVCVTTAGKPIKAKTVGQKKYVDAIKNNTVVFGIGPAGTGKTFLAVAMAVTALRNKEINRIILTRPAVEAGENLGFLPGDLQNKIDPYLRPLYDALYEMLGPENYSRYLEKGTIEIAPLAYMRGRTLDNSFIILDEAQNTTSEQMKMFLTRLGNGSKAVITGDVTQIDLPFGKRSGLREAESILADIDDIFIHHFTEKDVVRHKLVQKIIKAYEISDIKRESKRKDNKNVKHYIYKKQPKA